MPVRNTAMDDEVRPLIQHAAANAGQWVPFVVLDDAQFARTVRWFVNSKNSPFGWSPEGRPQSARVSFDIMWAMPGGQFSRDIKTPGVYHKGLRMGRLKIRHKKQERQA